MTSIFPDSHQNIFVNNLSWNYFWSPELVVGVAQEKEGCLYPLHDVRYVNSITVIFKSFAGSFRLDFRDV